MKAATSQALDWLYSTVPALDVAVRRWADGRPAMLHPARRPQQAGLERAGVERLLPWLGHENAHGADIYVRPARSLPTVPIVFLDDLLPAMAQRIAAKYAALAVQTSRKSAQAWILTAAALAEPERLTVQRALAQRVGADPASVSGEHFGRMPGFTNRKPTHSDHPWVTVLAATQGRWLDPAPLLQTARAPGFISGGPAAAARGALGIDASRTDWRLARVAVETGADLGAVTASIAAAALARGKRADTAGCLAYAERTVQKAARLGSAGAH